MMFDMDKLLEQKVLRFLQGYPFSGSKYCIHDTLKFQRSHIDLVES